MFIDVQLLNCHYQLHSTPDHNLTVNRNKTSHSCSYHSCSNSIYVTVKFINIYCTFYF